MVLDFLCDIYTFSYTMQFACYVVYDLCWGTKNTNAGDDKTIYKANSGSVFNKLSSNPHLPVNSPGSQPAVSQPVGKTDVYL